MRLKAGGGVVGVMIDWLTLAFLSVGFAFNLAGLFLGAKAFLATWHEFGEGP